MKFGQLIEYNEKYFPLDIMEQMLKGDHFETSLYEVKPNDLQLSFNIFQ